MTESHGIRIGNESLTIISRDEKIRCLRDQVVIEPLAWQPSKILEVIYHGRPLRGIVRVIGPGRYPKLYNGPKGRRTKSWDSKHFRPCDLKVGDIVELGGLELRGYLFTTFIWGNKEMVMCREADVAIVREDVKEAVA